MLKLLKLLPASPDLGETLHRAWLFQKHLDSRVVCLHWPHVKGIFTLNNIVHFVRRKFKYSVNLHLISPSNRYFDAFTSAIIPQVLPFVLIPRLFI